jgi:secondary thiamine-phosphate synthase enzyme
MKQRFHTLAIQTRGPGLTDFTGEAAVFVSASRIESGLLTCFVRHTSASLLIQENADPDVLADLENFFRRLVSRDAKLYRHTTEGPDDMPSHIRAALTQTSLSIPVRDGRLALGTWQGLYLYEHRDAAQTREVVLHLIGEGPPAPPPCGEVETRNAFRVGAHFTCYPNPVSFLKKLIFKIVG